MGRDGFYTVQVAAEGYGTQQTRLKDSAEEPAIRTIILRPTGRLEGRLISDNPEVIRNVKFYVSQDDYLGEYTYGTALVTCTWGFKGKDLGLVRLIWDEPLDTSFSGGGIGGIECTSVIFDRGYSVGCRGGGYIEVAGAFR